MEFKNKGSWFGESDDTLVSYNTQEHPDYTEGDDKVITYEDIDDDSEGIFGDDPLNEVEGDEEQVNEVRYIDPANVDRYDPSEIEEVTTVSGEKRYKRKSGGNSVPAVDTSKSKSNKVQAGSKVAPGDFKMGKQYMLKDDLYYGNVHDMMMPKYQSQSLRDKGFVKDNDDIIIPAGTVMTYKPYYGGADGFEIDGEDFDIDTDEVDFYNVEPSNYDKHDDLVDVVDKAGNPQKMTQATYDANKGSGEFKDVEKKEVKAGKKPEKLVPGNQPKEKESPKMTPKLFSAKNRDFSQYKKGQERFVADSFSAAALADASKEDLTKRVKELYDAGLSFDAVTSALSKEDIDHIYKTMDGFPNEYPEAERNRENLVYFMSKELEK